ncbi:conserved hypothetical protein [Vibrio phage 217E38-1]|nr:conserved hypothetical protein [Vibrio phage 511E55-1]CAH9016771.1 conserved hypothetical protein [Vibrio phage 217E38-1]
MEMFDANAAHIKCGELFFAEIHAVDAQLEKMGVNCGDIVLCKHKVNGESPRENVTTVIFTSIDCEGNEWNFDERNDDWSWMVYSGRPNGKGFINEKWKEKALLFMNGNWSK